MKVRDIIKTWLQKNKFDGLCNPDVPCGCKADDLAPCGMDGVANCQAGNIEWVEADEHCDCDECGTKHWHIAIPIAAGLLEQLADACNWLCECGQRANSNDGLWRWNGRAWEHHHGYPLGHVQAERKPIDMEAVPPHPTDHGYVHVVHPDTARLEALRGAVKAFIDNTSCHSCHERGDHAKHICGGVDADCVRMCPVREMCITCNGLGYLITRDHIQALKKEAGL